MTTKAEAAGRFRREVTKIGRCTLWRPNGDCSGPLDAAHYLPAQFLRRRFAHLPDEELWAIVYDARSARCLCRSCHHKTDHGFIRVFREDIPSTCWEWAREHQIDFRLVRDYASREVGAKI